MLLNQFHPDVEAILIALITLHAVTLNVSTLVQLMILVPHQLIAKLLTINLFALAQMAILEILVLNANFVRNFK